MYTDELTIANDCSMRFELTYRKVVRINGKLAYSAEDCKLYGANAQTLMSVLMHWNREGMTSNMHNLDYAYAPLGIVERIV